MYCLTCGCYISDILNSSCPACGAEKGVKVIEKIIYKEVTKDIEIDYSQVFSSTPIFHYDWFNMPKEGTKEYNYLKMMLSFAISKYPAFKPMMAYQIKDTFPVFSDIDSEELEKVLDDLAEENIIDVYGTSFGNRHYSRKPITKEEEKKRKKSYNKKYKYYDYYRLTKK